MPKDILLNATNDLQVTNGDFVIGESLEQQKKTLFFSEDGSFKETPNATVGAVNYLEDENPANLLRKVRQVFFRDGINETFEGANTNDKTTIKLS